MWLQLPAFFVPMLKKENKCAISAGFPMMEKITPPDCSTREILHTVEALKKITCA
jgi:hypothetical protein